MNEEEIKKASKLKAMGEEKISSLVLRFAFTTLTALLLNSVYNLTDALFVSRGVGDNAMGGVSIVFPFVIIQGAISTALGGGAASLVSRKLGVGKTNEAGEITINAMAAFYITAIFTTVLGFLFMNPILNAMGVTEELYPFAKQYLTIILAANVFSTGFSSIIRAEGKMLYGLLIWVIPIAVNIILDAVFILVLKWGVSGAAAATAACQFISFCMSVIFFSRVTTQKFKGAKIKIKKIGEILAIGLPSLVQMGSFSIIIVVLNNVLKIEGGTASINTFAYISKIITFAIVPFTAVTQALAPIAGYNFGAGLIGRTKKTVKFCIFISLIYAVFAIFLLEVLPDYFIGVFTSDIEIINQGAYGLRMIALSLFFIPLPNIIGATLQAIGKRLQALITYAANLIFMIPFAFVMPLIAGVDGIWWAYVIAGAAASILALIIIFKHKIFVY